MMMYDYVQEEIDMLLGEFKQRGLEIKEDLQEMIDDYLQDDDGPGVAYILRSYLNMMSEK